MITLELILDGSPYGGNVVLTLPMEDYVQNRVERFVYLRDIKPEAVPLDYVEFENLSVENSIQLVDKSFGVPGNALRMLAGQSGDSLSVSFVSEFDKLLITDKTALGKGGTLVPLYWAHELPAGTVKAKVYQQVSDNFDDLHEGVKYDYEAGKIYSNYRNQFNPQTGAYALYFVTTEAEDGSTTTGLLASKPAAHEATWEDIDLTTGRLNPESVSYIKTEAADGFLFSMSRSGRWYYQPTERSQLRPLLPAAKSSEDPWYLRVSVASVQGVINGARRRYSLPEWHTQAYAPYKPIMYSSDSPTWFVTNNVVKTVRPHLSINPDAGLHLDVLIQDHNGDYLFAFTTDTSKVGSRWSDTDVFWEDHISSWDNYNGFIQFDIDIQPSWEINVQTFYEAVDFQYGRVNLNPALNPDVANKLVVFYVIPDTADADRGLHHLIVNDRGEIEYCSQSQGISYPNLQLTDGVSYNSSTVIGLQYSSELSSDTFLGRYVAGFDNDNGYLILAEVVVTDQPAQDEYLVYDVRREGLRVTDASVLFQNARIQQSLVTNHENGMWAPVNKAMIIEPPLSLLEDYGGSLTKEAAERYLVAHLDTSVYPVIRWVWPQVELQATSVTEGEVELSWLYPGIVDSIILYRKENLVGEWVEITTIASPTVVDLQYTDTVTSGEVYHYGAAVVVDGVEYPVPYSITIEVL